MYRHYWRGGIGLLASGAAWGMVDGHSGNACKDGGRRFAFPPYLLKMAEGASLFWPTLKMAEGALLFWPTLCWDGGKAGRVKRKSWMRARPLPLLACRGALVGQGGDVWFSCNPIYTVDIL